MGDKCPNINTQAVEIKPKTNIMLNEVLMLNFRCITTLNVGPLKDKSAFSAKYKENSVSDNPKYSS